MMMKYTHYAPIAVFSANWATLHITVDGIVFVNDIDSVPFCRKLDVDCTATVVSGKTCFPLLGAVPILFHVAFPISVLQRIDTNIFETRTICAVFVEGLALEILESINGLENLDERPSYRSLDFEAVFSGDITT